MDIKLTLSMDEMVIEKAKSFARKNNTSLSQVIENYLSELTRKEKETNKQDISPLVKGLSGVLKVPGNFNYKKEVAKHLQEKYN